MSLCVQTVNAPAVSRYHCDHGCFSGLLEAQIDKVGHMNYKSQCAREEENGWQRFMDSSPAVQPGIEGRLLWC